jgi:hypothetical protein
MRARLIASGMFIVHSSLRTARIWRASFEIIDRGFQARCPFSTNWTKR